jgi:hypothetical protein
MAFYPQSATNQRACPNSLLFRYFHLIFTFESIKELGGASVHLIVGEYDEYVLFLLLVHAYKVLNSSTTSEIVVSIVNNSKLINYEMNNFKDASLYNLMQIDEKMVLLVVKERLNHYKIRKISVDECKIPFAWWKIHES